MFGIFSECNRNVSLTDAATAFSATQIMLFGEITSAIEAFEHI